MALACRRCTALGVARASPPRLDSQLARANGQCDDGPCCGARARVTLVGPGRARVDSRAGFAYSAPNALEEGRVGAARAQSPGADRVWP